MSDAAFTVAVSLDITGRHVGYVYSGKDLVLTTDDGHDRYFGYGLVSLDLPELVIGSATGSGVSLQVADGAVWEAAMAGRPVHDAVCRVYAVPPGVSALRSCVLFFEGIVNGVSFDADSGVCSLEVGPLELREEMPFPPGSIGDYLRFPNSAFTTTTSRDAAVPVIYGTCWDVPLSPLDALDTAAPGTATPNREWRYLIAGHSIAEETLAAGYVVDDAGAAVGGPYTVETAIDGLGGVFSYITVVESVDIPGGTEPPEQLYVVQMRGKHKGGKVIVGLGDILEDIWLNYGPNKTPLDYGRTTRAKNYLNAFAISARFDQVERNSTLATTLEARFAAQFPVSFGLWAGRFGWDYIGKRQDRSPVGRLVYGQNSFARGSLDTTARSDIVNAVEVDYQRSGRAAGTQHSYRLDASNSELCAASQSRWGVSKVVRLSVPDASQIFSEDSNAAYLAASELVLRHYDVFSATSYMTHDPRALRWSLGDPILVTDAQWGWTDKRFYLRGKRPSVDGYVTLDLESAEPFYSRE